MRWHVAHNTVGRGRLYQGRFQSFPIQEDEHFLTACRYVERPRNWVALVNQPMTEKEAEGFQTSMARNRPYGEEAWQDRQARRLARMHTLRGEGRPKAVTPKN